MLEKIAEMAENLQPSDFKNSSIEAGIIVIAKEGKVTIVGGGNILLQAQAIAKIIKTSNPLFKMVLMAAMKEDE